MQRLETRSSLARIPHFLSVQHETKVSNIRFLTKPKVLTFCWQMEQFVQFVAAKRLLRQCLRQHARRRGRGDLRCGVVQQSGLRCYSSHLYLQALQGDGTETSLWVSRLSFYPQLMHCYMQLPDYHVAHQLTTNFFDGKSQDAASRSTLEFGFISQNLLLLRLWFHLSWKLWQRFSQVFIRAKARSQRWQMSCCPSTIRRHQWPKTVKYSPHWSREGHWVLCHLVPSIGSSFSPLAPRTVSAQKTNPQNLKQNTTQGNNVVPRRNVVNGKVSMARI